MITDWSRVTLFLNISNAPSSSRTNGRHCGWVRTVLRDEGVQSPCVQESDVLKPQIRHQSVFSRICLNFALCGNYSLSKVLHVTVAWRSLNAAWISRSRQSAGLCPPIYIVYIWVATFRGLIATYIHWKITTWKPRAITEAVLISVRNAFFSIDSWTTQ